MRHARFISLTLLVLIAFFSVAIGSFGLQPASNPAYAKALHAGGAANPKATPAPTPNPNGGGDGGGGGTVSTAGMGIFGKAYSVLADLARQAWAFIVGLIVILVALGALVAALTGAAGASFGGTKFTSQSILTGLSLVVIVLIVFLILPSLGGLITSFQPKPPF